MEALDVIGEKAKRLEERQASFIEAMNRGDILEMYIAFVEEEAEHMETFSDMIDDPEAKAYIAMLVAACTMRCKTAIEAARAYVRENRSSLGEGQ